MPTYIARRKRTRILYVVLLCTAIAMSTWAVYNQVHSDSTSAQFADQINTFCQQNPAYANEHLNCQQAKAAQDNGAPVIQGERGPEGRQGIQGEPGIPGKNGENGINGIDGKNGVNGVDGARGTNGIDGKNGVDGKDGENGKDGNNGADGKDAPRTVSEDLDMASCTGTGHLSDGTSFPINMTGCTPSPVGGE